MLLNFYWFLALPRVLRAQINAFLLVTPKAKHTNVYFLMWHHRVLSTIQMLICRKQILQRWCINFCLYSLYFKGYVPNYVWQIPIKVEKHFLFVWFVFWSVPSAPTWTFLADSSAFSPVPVSNFLFQGKLWTEYIQQRLDCFFSSSSCFTAFLGARKSPRWHWCSSPLFLKLPCMCSSLLRSALFRWNTISIFPWFC